MLDELQASRVRNEQRMGDKGDRGQRNGETHPFHILPWGTPQGVELYFTELAVELSFNHNGWLFLFIFSRTEKSNQENAYNWYNSHPDSLIWS